MKQKILVSEVVNHREVTESLIISMQIFSGNLQRLACTEEQDALQKFYGLKK